MGLVTPPEAPAAGRICAVAGQSQRAMSDWASGYPALYGAKAFDPALFSTLALAAAFSGPWYTADQLRMANRVCLWCFGLDWLVDYAATSAEEVRDIVKRCAAVAAGAPPEDDLTHFLADIRDELGGRPGFAALGGIWHDELRRMLDAMALEWDWKAGTRPTFEEYLGNADNLGFSFVFTSHWIFTEGSGPVPEPDQVERLRAAAWAVQRVVRLLNDLGTYERDLKWGDLNGLMLGVGREEVERRVGQATGEARELIGRVRDAHPRLAGYMERQMDFCAGFYGVTDYWGTL